MQTELEPPTTRTPKLLRSRTLLWLGWTLLVISLALLCVDVLWMWNRLGRGGLLLAIALFMDALVGLGLIFAVHRMRQPN